MDNAQIQAMLYNLILTIVTTGLPIVITFIIKFVKQHTNAKQLQLLQSIAKNSILFTEQVSKDMNFDSSVKLSSAITSAQKLSKNYGINMDEYQWRSIIEASLLEFNKGYKDVLTPSNTFLSSNNSTILNPTEIVALENIPNTEINPKLALPEDMLTPLYASILDKSNEKAKLAVEQVITDVTKSITTEGEK